MNVVLIVGGDVVGQTATDGHRVVAWRMKNATSDASIFAGKTRRRRSGRRYLISGIFIV